LPGNLNNSETAFLLRPDADDHEVKLRYFTPETEVPICGHATIAAHFIRASEKNLPSCTIMHKTGAGVLPVTIEKKEDTYNIIMTQGQIEFEPPLENDEILSQLLTALGIKDSALNPDCPIQVVSTGHSKVLIGIREKHLLNSLNPDFNALSQLSQMIGSNGFFIFTLDSDDPSILTHARMFAPAIGINEDPVTGNGNGPLGAYLVHHNLVRHDGKQFKFQGRQGEAMGRAGSVFVEVAIENSKPVKTRVGGQAVPVFKTRLSI
jgi:PhzF family phenazine biosynthesis protein